MSSTGPHHPLPHARATWLGPDLLAWPRAQLPTHLQDAPAADLATTHGLTFSLLTAPDGGLRLSAGAPVLGPGDLETPLRVSGDVGSQAPQETARRCPHLLGHLALTLSDDDGTCRLTPDDVRDALRGQAAVLCRSTSALPDGGHALLTGVQTGPVLDVLYGDDAAADTSLELGVSWDRQADGDADAHGPTPCPGGPRPRFTLWAPTAQAVTLLTWETGDPTGSVPLVAGEPVRTPAWRRADGTWRVANGEGRIGAGCQYLWEVEVYAPTTGRVEVNRVTDPCSRALTTDSVRSVAVDLAVPTAPAPGAAEGTTCPLDDVVAPAGWDAPAPAVAREAARTVYELHVRDFSAADGTVPPDLRGTYAAFGTDSDGTRHLRALAEAGMDTLHLLPVFDFTSVPEDRADQAVPDVPPYASAASRRPQEAVGEVRDRDAYNWGYDPWHWMAPEGSYARPGRQDGGARVGELRAAVGAIHRLGLQVVLDQVYNHTAASGQDPRSVLDRIVPGYYHRLDDDGAVRTSAAGANTATERSMAERLMVDACVGWVRDYRVDGFRLDLMGFHPRATIERLREALREVEPLVGHEVLLYGEGWDMGEVAGNALFHQAVQGQLAGLRVATFNDRLRDGVHGGNGFDLDPRCRQGLGTGAVTDPNGEDERPADVTAADLAWRTDLVRAGLAGNLAGYLLRTPDGGWRRAADLGYGYGPAAYGQEPGDSMAYVSSHDDATLYDILAYKLPRDTPMEERVRMSVLCLACATLSQSPVLWAAGVEQLRSTSLDHDSYDSGDWFNAIDWSGRDNGWGRGLPGAWRNRDRWVVQAGLLADERLRPSPADIARARAMSLDLLRLRRSTPLLTLGSADLVHERVSFLCSGPDAVPGLVVMSVDDGLGEGDVDPLLDGVVVAVNARPQEVAHQVEALVGRRLELSPVQRDGVDERVRQTRFDPVTGTLVVPARTVAVLIER